MDSYLKGRPKTQKFTANFPAQKSGGSALNPQVDEDEIIHAKPAPDVNEAPDVDLVLHDGVVKKIVIHMPDGKILELECEYEEESAGNRE
jgi:hypothetical protein